MRSLLIFVLVNVVAALAAQPAAMTTSEVFCTLEKQDSSYIDLPNRVDTHYFYWYFESRSMPATDPLILWLPGGPGMGGTFGLLAENGPCSVNANLSTTVNPFSWTAQANMVWVDIPANSGFSYSTVPEDDEFSDDRVAESVFWFLQGFFAKHKELLGRELFIVGESYGGHFVPSVAHYIWKKQSEQLSSSSGATATINLQGIAMGNGLTDPTEVYPRTGEMVVNAYNITLTNETEAAMMKAAAPACRSKLTACQTNASACGDAGSYCWTTQDIPLLESLRSPYDIRQECTAAVANYSQCLLKVPSIKAYLDSPHVRELLGVHESIGEWILVNATINGRFFSAPSFPGFHSVAPLVSDLLDAGVRVMMYAGDADILCNAYATEALAEKLSWSGAQGFKRAEKRTYSTTSGIADAGMVRSYSRLTFVTVHNAGHMVPGDQPEVALDMINKFIHDEEL